MTARLPIGFANYRGDHRHLAGRQLPMEREPDPSRILAGPADRGVGMTTEDWAALENDPRVTIAANGSFVPDAPRDEE